MSLDWFFVCHVAWCVVHSLFFRFISPRASRDFFFVVSVLTIAIVANTDIDNPNLKKDLLIAANALYDNLQKMMAAVTAVADVTGISKAEEAIEGFDAIKIDLDTAEFAAAHGMLQPVPGQTRENALALLELAVKYGTSFYGQIFISTLGRTKRPWFKGWLVLPRKERGSTTKSMSPSPAWLRSLLPLDLWLPPCPTEPYKREWSPLAKSSSPTLTKLFPLLVYSPSTPLTR